MFPKRESLAIRFQQSDVKPHHIQELLLEARETYFADAPEVVTLFQRVIELMETTSGLNDYPDRQDSKAYYLALLNSIEQGMQQLSAHDDNMFQAAHDYLNRCLTTQLQVISFNNQRNTHHWYKDADNKLADRYPLINKSDLQIF